MGMNLLEVEEMHRAADAAGVFLGEKMWTRFFPDVKHVKELIRSNAIGEKKSSPRTATFPSP
jgi:predicted dehydrogenase